MCNVDCRIRMLIGIGVLFAVLLSLSGYVLADPRLSIPRYVLVLPLFAMPLFGEAAIWFVRRICHCSIPAYREQWRAMTAEERQRWIAEHLAAGG